jgi:hypothetical protein
MKKNIYNGKIINLMMVIGLLILTQTSSFSMESQNDSNFGSQKQPVDDQDITPQQPVDSQGTSQQPVEAQDITPQQIITAPQGLSIKQIASMIATGFLINDISKKNASKTPK